MWFRGKMDQRVAQAIRRRLGESPADILEILDAVRADRDVAMRGQEGLVHAILLRQVREQRVTYGGRSARGLLRYGLAAAGVSPGDEVQEVLAPKDRSVREAAERVTKGLREEETRERVHADVAAHLETVRSGTGPGNFGSVRGARHVLDRVGRGRATVVFARSPGDALLRLLVHEGPWLLAVVGIYFALQIFVLRVYQIPSPSMVPTLQVNDRVVVVHLGRSPVPERWSVVTYVRGKLTYVKRVVGLPGEEFALQMGDVFANGKLLVKPEELVESLRAQAYLWEFVPGSPMATDAPGEPRRFDSPQDHLSPDGIHGSVYAFSLQDGMAVLKGSRSATSKVELELARRSTDPQDSARFTLVLDGSGMRLLDERGEGKTVELARAPGAAPVGNFEIELGYVDGRVRVRTPSWNHTEERRAPYGALRPSVRLGPGAVAASLRLDRDLHYSYDGGIGAPSGDGLPLNPHDIPPGHVFFLGDNTNNSRDSRWAEVSDIPLDQLIGPVKWCIWPPSRLGRVR